MRKISWRFSSSVAQEVARLRLVDDGLFAEGGVVGYGFEVEQSQRMLNAVEPGTVVLIHRHPTKDESFVVLRGKVRVTTYNDDGSVIESVVLCQEEGRYGVDIKKGVWHNLESMEPDSVIFECKEGPFVEHEEEGVMTVKG